MPTYEYVCRSCGHLFEIVQSMRDDALTECPECGGELRKVFAPPAISFKGSGFYATDQRKKATTGSGDKGDTGEKGEKGEKGDTKPDAASSDGKQDPKRDTAAAVATKKETATTTSTGPGAKPSSTGSSSGSSSKDGSGS